MLLGMDVRAAHTEIAKITKFIIALHLIGKARIGITMAFDLDAEKSVGTHRDHIRANLADGLVL